MSVEDDARQASAEVTRSGRDGLAVRVHSPVGAFYSFHLYRGTTPVATTTYLRSDSHTFGGLESGTYRCRVFVRTADGVRFPVATPRITIPSRAPVPAPAPGAVLAAPDPRWTAADQLPVDSDYGSFLPAVTRWPSVEAFSDAPDWSPGVHVVDLPSGLHVDLYLGGDPATIAEDRALPVIFSGAVSKRNGSPGPFFSGIGLGRSIGSPFVALSDATLNMDRELTLAWYAGRCGDGLQHATLALLTAVSARYGRELVLVGGSGGGFASLLNAARLDVPASAFVWNPQTDLLDYHPRILAQYLTRALPASLAVVAAMSREERSAALLAGGVEHRVRRAGAAPGQRRVLYLQNAGDGHVIGHAAPYLEQGQMRHTGGGRWADAEGVLVVISAFGEGHDPPPREVLVEGLRAMLDASTSPTEVVDLLQSRSLLPSTGLETLPRDLRAEAQSLRESLSLTARRDASGQIRASLQWQGLPNRYGGISTSFELAGGEATVTRSHRANAVVVPDAPTGVSRVTARVLDGFQHELFQLEADLQADPQRLGTYIVGSCVARDSFEFLDPRFFALRGYLARQSLISAFGRPARPPMDPARLSSPFQRRMLEADAESALPELLREAAPEVDLLLWDLVDERLGVLDHPDGGVSTDSVELRTHRVRSTADTLTSTPFGSVQHLDRFTAALPAWRDLLVELELLGRTVLVAPPWAARSTTGEPIPTSFGLSATEANRLTQPYLERAVEVLGVPVVGRSLPAPTALPTHQWGLAPFHYDDTTYRQLATEVSATAATLCRPFGWAEDPSARTRIPTAQQRSPAGREVLSVSLTQTGPLEVTATVTASDMLSCAFALHDRAQQLAITPYQRTGTHTFRVPKPDVYRCRAYVLQVGGQRIPVVSSALRVR